jgi:hypothetical protein
MRCPYRSNVMVNDECLSLAWIALAWPSGDAHCSNPVGHSSPPLHFRPGRAWPSCPEPTRRTTQQFLLLKNLHRVVDPVYSQTLRKHPVHGKRRFVIRTRTPPDTWSQTFDVRCRQWTFWSQLNLGNAVAVKQASRYAEVTVRREHEAATKGAEPAVAVIPHVLSELAHSAKLRCRVPIDLIPPAHSVLPPYVAQGYSPQHRHMKGGDRGGRNDWNLFDPKYLDTAWAPSRPSIKRIAPPT